MLAMVLPSAVYDIAMDTGESVFELSSIKGIDPCEWNVEDILRLKGLCS
jgi:hypothetical protein